MDSIKIFSPSSVANLSCGFDVLGLCLDTIGDEMIIKKSKKPIFIIGNWRRWAYIEKNVAGAKHANCKSQSFTEFKKPLEIYKKIKAGSGIGSSAASAAGSWTSNHGIIRKRY